MDAESPAEPSIALEQLSAERTESPERWHIRWRIRNVGSGQIQISSIRLPHGQFRADEQCFEPKIELLSGSETEFTVAVRCVEPAGPVTDNAFVIFSAIWSDARWRIFVRLRVIVAADGMPGAETEFITTQKVGFSGVP